MGRYLLKDGTPAPRTSNILDLVPKDLKSWAAKVAVEKVYNHTVREGQKLRVADIAEFKNEYKNISGRACDIGTLAHAYIESFISARLGVPDMSEKERWQEHVRKNYGGEDVQISKNCFDSFLKFNEEISPHYIETEMRGVSEEHGYGGTVDCLAIVGGVPTVLDWKTSGRIYDKYNLQMAAYWNLAREVSGFEAEQAIIVRFDKNKKLFYQIKSLNRDQLSDNFGLFSKMCSAYRSMRELGYVE